MKLKQFFDKIFKKHLFNITWKCNICDSENFNGDYFCDDCKSQLPLNDGAICNHCGRALLVGQEYCSTCKNTLTNIDVARSAFIYQEPISNLIKQFKYDNKRYFADIFAKYLSNVYIKNYMNCDLITFVPMTKKAKRKRSFNQSELLAKSLSKLINLPVVDVLIKKQDTDSQATLNREERRKNLTNVFKVSFKKEIKNKDILVVDDVTTTGSTGEIIATKLKKAGAKTVKLLTVASVPPIDRY